MLTAWLRRRALRLPPRLRARLLRVVDFVYPTWRSYAGESADRSRASLDDRWRLLHERKRLPTVCLGPVYLDLDVSPVRHSTATEVSDLDQIRMTAGGSAVFVCTFLHQLDRRGHLVSHVGTRDEFGKILRSRFERNSSLRGARLSYEKRGSCAVSISLIDPTGAPSPTYTHMGVLRSLTWDVVLRPIQHLFRRTGGVLYIGGYFRTGLDSGLIDGLNRLPPATLVVLDHGRFLPADCVQNSRALREAFRRRAVDVYICTYAELLQLAETAGYARVDITRPRREVEHLLEWGGLPLPEVTVVRGDIIEGRPNFAMLIRGGTVQEFSSRENSSRGGDRGGKNAFTAGFIASLYTNDGRNLREAINHAVTDGIAAWDKVASSGGELG